MPLCPINRKALCEIFSSKNLSLTLQIAIKQGYITKLLFVLVFIMEKLERNRIYLAIRMSLKERLVKRLLYKIVMPKVNLFTSDG